MPCVLTAFNIHMFLWYPETFPAIVMTHHIFKAASIDHTMIQYCTNIKCEALHYTQIGIFLVWVVTPRFLLLDLKSLMLVEFWPAEFPSEPETNNKQIENKRSAHVRTSHAQTKCNPTSQFLRIVPPIKYVWAHALSAGCGCRCHPSHYKTCSKENKGKGDIPFVDGKTEHAAAIFHIGQFSMVNVIEAVAYRIIRSLRNFGAVYNAERVPGFGPHQRICNEST